MQAVWNDVTERIRRDGVNCQEMLGRFQFKSEVSPPKKTLKRVTALHMAISTELLGLHLSNDATISHQKHP